MHRYAVVALVEFYVCKCTKPFFHFYVDTCSPNQINASLFNFKGYKEEAKGVFTIVYDIKDLHHACISAPLGIK